jgi:hypothetical protein
LVIVKIKKNSFFTKFEKISIPAAGTRLPVPTGNNKHF